MRRRSMNNRIARVIEPPIWNATAGRIVAGPSEVPGISGTSLACQSWPSVSRNDRLGSGSKASWGVGWRWGVSQERDANECAAKGKSRFCFAPVGRAIKLLCVQEECCDAQVAIRGNSRWSVPAAGRREPGAMSLRQRILWLWSGILWCCHPPPRLLRVSGSCLSCIRCLGICGV
jgi:hypothetical protein